VPVAPGFMGRNCLKVVRLAALFEASSVQNGKNADNAVSKSPLSHASTGWCASSTKEALYPFLPSPITSSDASGETLGPPAA